jgi:aminomethyltransferase
MNAEPILRPRLLEPGLARVQPDTECYRVPGAGSIVVGVEAGDRLTIVDTEGGQPCELLVFDAQGRSEPGLIQAAADGDGAGLRALLGKDDESARMVRAGLERRGINLADTRAIRLFDTASAPGEGATFHAQGDGVCVVAAPGEDMLIDGQNPPTDLEVVIHRARSRTDSELHLPEPLADPRLDLRVNRATAEPYLVRAGEFIQIIDVAGRQCSDFVAFSQGHLDVGLERGLDATTTRSLMGAAYPSPGLFSKFFDQDMQPLVEVIRDTVGRHDTFNLACTAKYYEDLGYFGHANCSDNFNTVLESYGVVTRKGWPAINFFYNTAIDAQNVLYFDEPWSRPGDYVLLRASTDLVCASSACPCDVDAANGWNPTDIQVRVYPAKNTFSKAVAFRMSPESEPKLTRETAFHARTSQLTRNFVEYRGYWLPNSFTDYGAVAEYHACRERAAVMDLSALRKFEVLGPDSEALMQWCITRNVRKLAVGQVVYSAMCYEHGGMLDDGTLLRLGADNFRWICGEEYAGTWLREQTEKLGLRVSIKSSTDQIHNIAVQGPRSREILAKVVWTPPTQPTLEELGWFRFCVGRVGDFNGIPIMVSRTGYSGELGYELWCHPRDAVALWDAVWAAGESYGLAPLGLEALDMLRIEAGLIFAGYEFCDQTDPFEAGIGFTVPLKSKEDDFLGRDALIRRRANPHRALVGLELQGNEPAANGDCVHVGRAQVGEITSATRSPILRKNIALCRIDVGYSEIGAEVEVGKLDGHQKRIPATVVGFPFYDPEKKRVRSGPTRIAASATQ